MSNEPGGTWGLYARVSDPKQALEGLSVDAQLSALREWAKQKGYQAHEYSDRGKSAWTEDLAKRPEFKRMLDDVHAGTLDGVAVTHIDRFSRKLIVTLTVLGEFGQRGVGFVSLENAAFDFSRPADRLLLAVLGAFAQYYSDELSRKIRRGWAERASKGLHVGTVPFGYCNGKCPGCGDSCEHWGKVKRDEPPIVLTQDALGVPLAFESYRLDTHTDATIARILNEAGYRSRTRKGRVLWNKHSVCWLLTNLFYAGKVVVKGKEYPGKHVALISEELFKEVQAIRQRHSRGPRTYAPKHRVYLFAGIAVCSGCGRRMRAIPYGGGKEVHRGYRCTAEESGKVSCTKPQTPIAAEHFEEHLCAIIENFRLPTDWRERIRQMLAQNGERQNTESERRGIAEKLKRLKWIYVEGDLTQAEYDREKHALEARLATLTIPQEREVMDAGAYLESLAAIWNEATLAERREMTLALLNQIVLDPETRRVKALKPKAAFALLFRQNPDLIEKDGVFEVKS